ncbi:hypothetical protein BV22DRAFT_829886 [Leucogyrophana mollusca]|uniref:Uncharacterized protein n=1 Tax=Leucogyrophana mollusca TaxID=85980 RepID=A0ACB8B2N2_9AGAM|nr:hypothetical protein BV22DRAFT_829886 [Leucogyrophana mollusca]
MLHSVEWMYRRVFTCRVALLLFGGLNDACQFRPTAFELKLDVELGLRRYAWNVRYDVLPCTLSALRHVLSL